MRNNKKGIALIYVIVTLSVIMILGTATLGIAYSSLKNAQVYMYSEQNKHKASSALDTIMSELTAIATEAYNNAYLETLGTLKSGDSAVITNGKCKDYYVKELHRMLCDSDNDIETAYNNHYSVSLLNKIAGNIYPEISEVCVDNDGVEYTNKESPDVTSEKVKFIITAEQGKNYLEETADALILRNVHVFYESDDGYSDDIVADIYINTNIVEVTQYPVLD